MSTDDGTLYCSRCGRNYPAITDHFFESYLLRYQNRAICRYCATRKQPPPEALAPALAQVSIPNLYRHFIMGTCREIPH